MEVPQQPIYLDCNATTPILPEVLEAMLPYLREHFGNPSSLHPYGRIALVAIDKAREEVALLLGCLPEEIIFTSGGTEANNLAILGSAAAVDTRCGLVTSVIEHPAVARPCEVLEHQGTKVTRVSVDEWGVVRTDEAREALERSPQLLTVMHANNETGSIQPIAELAAAAKDHGTFVYGTTP